MASEGLSAVVVGAGIGGLAAAIALRRAGHNVKILERSSREAEAGAAITVPPNSARILKRWGVDFENARMNPYSGVNIFTADGETLDSPTHFDFSDMEESFGSPYLLSHRVDLHEALRDLTSASGKGSAVEIVNNARVLRFNPSEGTVHYQAGGSEDTIQADLIVAADGVHSKAYESLGLDHPAIPSNETVIRFLIATKDILKDPETAPLLRYGDNQGSLYLASNKKRWLFRYPCRNNTLQNFGLYSTDSNNDYGMHWRGRMNCDRPALLHAMRDFHPSLIALADKTTRILPLWLCMERAPLPRYTEGKLVLVGDAAHPMLPHMGQGASQAMEDAAALEVLFNGVQKNQGMIADRLSLFDKVRRDRATIVQIMSHSMMWDQGGGGLELRYAEFVPGTKPPSTKRERHMFCYGHDIALECESLLHEQSSGLQS